MTKMGNWDAAIEEEGGAVVAFLVAFVAVEEDVTFLACC
jgi:hypothetical protein